MAWPTVTGSAAGAGVRTAGPASGVTLVWAHTVGAAQTILHVLVGQGTQNATNQVNSVTWNGAALTKKSIDANDGAWTIAQIWELANPTPATGNVVVTYGAPSGSETQIFGCAISFDGASTTTGAVFTATGTSTNPSVTVTDSASGDIVISFLVNDNQAGPTTEAGTLIGEAEDVGGDTDHNGQRQTATGSSTTCSWTNSGSGSKWSAIGIAVKQAGGAAPAFYDDGSPILLRPFNVPTVSLWG